MKLIEEYKRLRLEYIKRNIKGKGRVCFSQFANRCVELAEKVFDEKLTKMFDKEKLKRKIREELRKVTPIFPREFEIVKGVTVAEISWESGIHASHLLDKYLKDTDFLYVVSPFLDFSDISEMWKKTFLLKDFRVITNFRKECKDLKEKAKLIGCQLRYLDVHAKLLICKQACVVGSMNFNIDGFSPRCSIELVLIIKDPRLRKFLIEKFNWWWELAGDFEKAEKEKV